MKNSIRIILVLAILLSVLPFNVSAIGQMTKLIVIENAIRGEEYENIVTAVNTEEEDVLFGLSTEGDIVNWTSFYSFPSDDKKISITSIKIPAKGNRNAIARFTIPEDLPNGVYKGAVNVFTIPKKMENEKKTAASIIQKISRQVEITVGGEEINDCQCHIIPENLKLKRDESLKFNISCRNTGNIKIKPLVQQKIFKNDKTIFNVIHPFPEERAYIRPNSLEKWGIEWQTMGQDNGQYNAEIKILLESEIVRENNFIFTVGSIDANNTNDANEVLNFVSRIGGGNTTLGWFFIGGFVSLLSIFSFTIIRKRRKREEYKKE